MEMNRFRPQGIDRKYLLRRRLQTGRYESWNWQTRAEWYPVGWNLNRRTLGRIFSRLHYLACHAPAPVRARYRGAYLLFYNQHFAGRGRASVRYLNTYTAHAWM